MATGNGSTADLRKEKRTQEKSRPKTKPQTTGKREKSKQIHHRSSCQNTEKEKEIRQRFKATDRFKGLTIEGWWMSQNILYRIYMEYYEPIIWRKQARSVERECWNFTSTRVDVFSCPHVHNSSCFQNHMFSCLHVGKSTMTTWFHVFKTSCLHIYTSTWIHF